MRPLRSPWPWAGLCLGLLVTLISWALIYRVEEARLDALKTEYANGVVLRVERQMTNLATVLRGAAGYLGRGDLPTRAEWHDYVASLDLPINYPGLQGLSFVEWIPREELPAHVRRVRREGFPDYAVTPGGPGDPMAEGAGVILYLEPLDARNQRAFGRDMLAEANRREAMLRARDTGQVIASDRLTLYQETEADAQPGMVLFAPVYRQGPPLETVAGRRRALRGWTTIPLRLTDFMRATLPLERRLADIEIYDGLRVSPEHLLFDSNPASPGSEPGKHQVLTVAGRVWTTSVEPSPAFYQQIGRPRHWLAPLVGGAVSLLVFLILAALARTTQRARSLAEARGEELLATEAQFRALFERAPYGMAIVDSGSGRFLSVNPKMGDILGYPTEALLARDFQSFTHPEHLAQDLAAVRDLASGAVPVVHKEKRYLHRDGHAVWARLSMVKLPVAADAPARHLSVVEDISETRRRDRQLLDSEARFHSIFELSPDPMTLTRLSDGLLVEVNQAWCDLTGIPRQENLGRSTVDLGLWTRPEERDAFIAGLRQSGAFGPAEITLMSRDGREHRLLVTVKVLEVAGESCFLSLGKDVTEHDRIESALRESEARWQFALDGAGDGVWDWSAASDSMFVSRGYKAMLGYGADEDLRLSYADWIERIHPDDRDQVMAAADGYLDGHMPMYQTEYRIRRRDGSYIWILARGMAVEWDGDGRPTRMIGTHADISERKSTEDSLRLSESRLRILGDQLPDSFLYQFLSRSGETPRFLYLSAGVERLCGLRAEEVVRDPKLLFSQLDPDMLPAYLEAETASGREHCPFAMDLRQRHADGRWRWFRVRSKPRPQPDGSVLWEGISTDITEAQEARLLLEEGEARFRGVVEHAADAIYIHDEHERIVFANPEAARTTGHSLADLLDMHVWDLDQETDKDLRMQSWKTMVPGQKGTAHTRIRRRDGSTFPVEVRFGLLQQEPRLFLTVVRDLTERERIIEADARARKAEGLVLMAGSIAHDFNNIFQGVLGFLEVAAIKAGGNADLGLVLGKAEASLRKAIGLSWKMLDFSGRALVKQELLDLEAWLPAYAATLQLELPTTFLLDVSCEPMPLIRGDRARLKEVLQALVANALEAAEPLAGRVRLRLYTDFGEGRPGPASPGIWPLARPRLPATVCLEVSDEGPGVPAMNLERICDPFFTTRELGRGLGLASVTGILQAHRAGLHIFNGEGGGLVVRMHFPPGGA